LVACLRGLLVRPDSVRQVGSGRRLSLSSQGRLPPHRRLVRPADSVRQVGSGRRLSLSSQARLPPHRHLVRPRLGKLEEHLQARTCSVQELQARSPPRRHLVRPRLGKLEEHLQARTCSVQEVQARFPPRRRLVRPHLGKQIPKARRTCGRLASEHTELRGRSIVACLMSRSM
jgi:hypothetical protein